MANLVPPPARPGRGGNLPSVSQSGPQNTPPMNYANLLLVLLLCLAALTACAMQPLPEPSSPATRIAPIAEHAGAPTSTPPAEPQPAPTAQPSPPSRNVALAGVWRSSEGEETAHLAFDDNPETNWNANNLAAQWIAVTLDALYLVDRIELVVAQAPAGPTTHLI